MTFDQLQKAARNRQYKQRQRDMERARGVVTVQVKLTQEEAMMLLELRERQRGPMDNFYRRALVTGALFVANSGCPRGAKSQRNGVTAERGTPISDTSDKTQGGASR